MGPLKFMGPGVIVPPAPPFGGPVYNLNIGGPVYNLNIPTYNLIYNIPIPRKLDLKWQHCWGDLPNLKWNISEMIDDRKLQFSDEMF